MAVRAIHSLGSQPVRLRVKSVLDRPPYIPGDPRIWLHFLSILQNFFNLYISQLRKLRICTNMVQNKTKSIYFTHYCWKLHEPCMNFDILRHAMLKRTDFRPLKSVPFWEMDFCTDFRRLKKGALFWNVLNIDVTDEERSSQIYSLDIPSD